jgi:iron complex transport system substrate-binding protein
VNAEEVSAIVVDTAYHLHRRLGPGLLESVYESLLASVLERRGLRVGRQVLVEFDFDGIHFAEGLRVDLLVEGVLVVELKSVERSSPVHAKQVLTYLRLLNLPVGLLINFGAPTFREGVRRVVNGPVDMTASHLRVNRDSLTRRHEDTKTRRHEDTKTRKWRLNSHTPIASLFFVPSRLRVS